MQRLLYVNEHECMEITDAYRIYVDSEKQNEIVFLVNPECIRLRLTFEDIREVVSSMNKFFNMETINIVKFLEETDNVKFSIEQLDFDDIMSEYLDMFGDEYDDFDDDDDEDFYDDFSDSEFGEFGALE